MARRPTSGKTSRKPATSKRPAAKRAAKKRPTKTGAKRATAKPKRATAKAKRTQRKPVLAPVRSPRSFKQALVLEALTWGSAVLVGLAITGGLLWMRAKSDVTAYLADPPRSTPGVIWSAPMQVAPGQRASISSLAGDLLAAGYERVDHVQQSSQPRGVGEFALTEQGLDILSHPSGTHPGGHTQLILSDGHVVGGAPAVFHPTVLATIGDWETRRSEIDLSAVSASLEPALLSMEDQRFREHYGIDPWGVTRAVLTGLVGRGGQGGSTLTQQLAKNLFLTPERTMRRKVREVFFAAALESELTKDELLELYLEEVYLGQMGGVPLYGVESASRAWFGVSAARLELHQAATLIGVIPAPNAYSPRRHPDRAEQRRDLVLDQMTRTGAISESQANAAKAEPLALNGSLPGAIRRAPFAVDLAVDAAERHLGEGSLAGGGFHVHTSIQPLLQRAAEEAVTEGMRELDTGYPKARGAQVALVAVRVSDGAVVAMVGSRNYAESPFNRAVNAWRQAGSTVKPLTLLAAFDSDPGLTPLTPVLDEPISRRIDGKTWTPRNHDGAFLGEITLRKAIEASRNIPAVTLAEEVGPRALQAYYRDAGLSRATRLPSAALGAFETTPLELATAYTAFPGGGTVHRSWIVDRIEEPNGDVVLDLEPETHDLSTARASSLASSVLQGVIERGTGSRAKKYGVSGHVGGKTGTTSNFHDAWFVGFTRDYAVAVWVGQDRGDLGLAGSRAALPTWARFVASTGQLSRLPLPDGIVTAPVCGESSRPARPECPHTYTEHFPEGEIPHPKCDVHGGPLVELGGSLSRLFKRR